MFINLLIFPAVGVAFLVFQKAFVNFATAFDGN